MKKESNILIFYVPCPNKEAAEKLSNQLLNLKLIACSNVLKGSSMYEWEDALTEEPEVYLVVKTVIERENDIESFIKESHPYDLPCIARWEARVNKAYYEWVEKACSS